MTQRQKRLPRIVESVLVRTGALLRDSQYKREPRESFERGIADADAGRLIPVEELMREFGVDEK
jgi:hypothetical protein